MITRLAKAGLAAALSVTTLATGAAASTAAPADAPSPSAQHVTVSLNGFPPSTTPPGPGQFSVGWTSAGTQDLTGPTHLTVDLPPGLTTDGAMFYSTPYDYTFTESVSPDGRHLEAVLIGTRTPGHYEFMKMHVYGGPTQQPTGQITATVANPNDTDPTGHVAVVTLDGSTPAPVVQPAPAVDGLDTTTGPGAGGTAVTVSGSNLAHGMVLVGGVPAPGTCTDTACTVTTPGGSGSAPVSVVTPGGTAAAPAAFDYTGAPPPAPPVPTVSQVWTPASAPVAGGTQAYIIGDNLTYGTVTFGGVPGLHTSCGPKFCSVTTPPAAGPGPVDVVVTTAGGTSTPVTFTYTA
ncbi:IPT/TIG domain-containing protein [Kitasatospora aureofaciens]|uniref:IPT/TIG domain-containing protein n=1 Tax=Kitasatospora aureofaciens TaxID=1894 RepID=UPI001C47AFF0|nr:IPT/TIG domain-containing protein [Kitasatospora aureofaciens]MBV6700760.1 IPT/TIG domain-containing protein [Kitasatospora aureofaciens]